MHIDMVAPEFWNLFGMYGGINIQWRLHITNAAHLLAQYPYVPPHITKPKEEKKIYLVTLPEKS